MLPRGQRPSACADRSLGALNELMGDEDVVINAAGSMPGDLQALWQAKTPRPVPRRVRLLLYGLRGSGRHGRQAGAFRSPSRLDRRRRHLPDAPMELATVAQEGIKVIYVLLQNYGFASIGALSESRGSQRFGTKYRQRGTGSHLEDTDTIAGVDIAANARSWGIDVLEVHTIEEFKEAYKGGRRLGSCDHDPHRDRPDGPQPARILLVGRGDLGGICARVDAACVRGLPERSQAYSAPLPVMC